MKYATEVKLLFIYPSQACCKIINVESFLRDMQFNAQKCIKFIISLYIHCLIQFHSLNTIKFLLNFTVYLSAQKLFNN